MAKWLTEHVEPAETVTVKPEVSEPVATSPEATVELQETADIVAIPEVKKRKATVRKVKAVEL